jgi:hypothetical protein
MPSREDIRDVTHTVSHPFSQNRQPMHREAREIIYEREREGSKRTMLLHDGQELDNDLGARADQDLALAGLLGVVDGVEGIVENRSLDHFGGVELRFSDRLGNAEK